MRVVIDSGRVNPGSRSAPETAESLAPYSDLQSEQTSFEVDWRMMEIDHIAEQTLGSGPAF